MPVRRLPGSDKKRIMALEAAKTKSDSLPPGAESPLSPGTKARLDAKLPFLQNLLSERGSALSKQSKASQEEDTTQADAGLVINHFIQVFNMGVARKKFPDTARAFYGLEVNRRKVPKLTAESDIVLWGQRLIDGDAKRVAAGGAPMTNPSVATLQVAYSAFMTEHNTQSGKKDAYDRAQEAVEKDRPDTDDLITDIWDEVEFFFRKDEASSKRRKAREWGVVYIQNKIKEVETKPEPPLEP